MSDASTYPMALPSPLAGVSAIDEALIARAKSAARASPRKRIIQPLHKGKGDLLQRMLNVIQPGSYIRPHRHAADRAESIVVLSGAMLYFTFDEAGAVEECLELGGRSARRGVDLDGGIYHSFLALEPDTVLFEVKPGPYDAATDKEFAPWAPAEYSAEAAAYLEELWQYSTTSR